MPSVCPAPGPSKAKSAKTPAPAAVRSLPHAAVSGLGSGWLQRKCACGGTPGPGGECEACRKKREGRLLQRQASSRSAIVSPETNVLGLVHDVLRSPGHPLPAETRAYMEPRFGYDFSQVRIHTNESAAASAHAVDALAYTVGPNLVFGSGQYSPDSPHGRQLLAHELTHVVQQASAPANRLAGRGGLNIGHPNGPAEQQADQMAAQVGNMAAAPAGGSIVRPLRSEPGNLVQRQVARSARTSPAVSRGAPIVADGQRLAPGQMHRSAFLATLRDTLIQECEAELAPYGRTAKGCPFILRTIEYYASRPVSLLMKLVQKFGRPPAGADAAGMIRAVVQRARIVSRRVAERRSQRLQASPENPHAGLAPHDPAAIRSELGQGRPLEGDVRENMENSFGRSFASVQIHADSNAAQISSRLGARAFAVGQDIAFGEGQYQPNTLPGDRLLAHELAHTVQQGTSRNRTTEHSNDRELEKQADQAAENFTAGRRGESAPLGAGEAGMRIQRWPAVVAGALLVGEVGTEAVVVAEIAAVTTEVVVIDSALVVGAEVAVPAAIELAAPAAIELAAPVVIETVAPAVASSSSLATAAVATTAAATTLSSDSPTTEKEEEQRSRRCQSMHPEWPPCFDFRTMEQVAESFARFNGFDAPELSCYGRSSMPSIDHCGGGPGENWHCDVKGSDFVVSLFKCHCCGPDGNEGASWVPHQSSGEGDGGAQRRQDTRGDRRNNSDKDRQRRERRENSED